MSSAPEICHGCNNATHPDMLSQDPDDGQNYCVTCWDTFTCVDCNPDIQGLSSVCPEHKYIREKTKKERTFHRGLLLICTIEIKYGDRRSAAYTNRVFGVPKSLKNTDYTDPTACGSSIDIWSLPDYFHNLEDINSLPQVTNASIISAVVIPAATQPPDLD
jgi:hypothetical protein